MYVINYAIGKVGEVLPLLGHRCELQHYTLDNVVEECIARS